MNFKAQDPKGFMTQPQSADTEKAKKKKKKLLTADDFFKIKDSKKKFHGPKSTKGSVGDTVNIFRQMDDEIIRRNLKKGGSVKKKKSSRKALRGGGCEIR